MAYQGGQLYTLDVGKDTQHPYKTVTIERPVDELALRIYRTAVLQIRQGVAMVFSEEYASTMPRYDTRILQRGILVVQRNTLQNSPATLV